MAGKRAFNVKIAGLRSYLFRLFFTDGLARTLTVLAIATAVLAMFSYYARLGSAARWVVLVGLCTAALVMVVQYIIRPLMVRLSEDDLAVAVERAYPGLQEKLISAVQFDEDFERESRRQSPEMMQAVIDKAEAEIQGIDFRKVVHLERIKNHLVWAGVALLMFGMLMLTDTFPSAMARLVNPALEYQQWTKFDVELTDATGEPLKLRDGAYVAARGDEIRFKVIPEKGYDDPGNVTIEMAFEQDTTGGDDELTMVKNDNGTYTYALPSVGGPFTFSVLGGDYAIRDRSVEIEPRPAKLGESLVYRYPDYTQLASRQDSRGGGEIRAPIGTTVEVAIELNKSVDGFRLALGRSMQGVQFASYHKLEKDGRVLAEFEIDNKAGGKRLVGTVTVLENVDIAIDLRDHFGFTTGGDYIRKSIRVIPDHAPVVKVMEDLFGGAEPMPSEKQVVPEATVAMLAEVTDKYGVKSIWLEWRPAGQDEFKSVEIYADPTPETFGEPTVEHPWQWDLAPLELKPGTRLNYRLAASDYATHAGDKGNIGRSEDYVLYVVTRTEIISIQKQAEQALIEQLERIRDDQEQVAGEVQQAYRKLIEAQSMTEGPERDKAVADARAELKGLVVRQQQVAKQYQVAMRTAQRISQAYTRNKLDMEAMARQFNRNVGQMRDLDTGHMEPTTRQVEQSVDQQGEKLASAVRDGNRMQLDTARQLGKLVLEMRKWESGGELLQKARELLQAETELKKDTDDFNTRTIGKSLDRGMLRILQELADRQEEIRKQTVVLKERIFESIGKLAKVDDNPTAKRLTDVLQKALDGADRDRIVESMKQAVDDLNNRVAGKALVPEQEAIDGLTTLVKNLEKVNKTRDPDKVDELREAGEVVKKALENQKNINSESQNLRDLAEALQAIEKAAQDVGKMLEAQKGVTGRTGKIAKSSANPEDPKAYKEPTDKQDDLKDQAEKTGEDVDKARNKADQASKGESSASKAMGKARQALGKAAGSMSKASKGMSGKSGQSGQSGKSGKAQPKQAQQEQKQAEKNLEQAKGELDKAAQQLRDEIERRSEALAKKQAENEKLAKQLEEKLKKLGEKDKDKEQLAKNAKQAQKNMNKAQEGMQDAQKNSGGKKSSGGSSGGQQGPKKKPTMKIIKPLRQAEEEGEKAEEELGKVAKELGEEIEGVNTELLTTILEMVGKMREIQRQVNEGTTDVDLVRSRNGGELSRADINRVELLATRQGEARAIALKGLDMLEKDGTAPTFADTFRSLSSDMLAVKNMMDNRLTGQITQHEQAKILEMLDWLAEALELRLEDIKKRKGGGGGGGGGNPPPPKPEPLVPPLAELQLLKLRQMQVNRDTRYYSKLKTDDDLTIVEKKYINKGIERTAGKQGKVKDLLLNLLDALEKARESDDEL